MDRLFRDRMEYIGGGAREGCFLCDAANTADEKGSLVVSRSARCVLLMNKYPYNSGHLLVAPHRHVNSLEGLTPEDEADIFRLITTAISLLQSEMKAEGFNVGANLGSVAGAGVPDHIHFHIVPRWAGDTNFMPVLAETKVIPEDLEKTWQRLRAAVGGDQEKQGPT